MSNQTVLSLFVLLIILIESEKTVIAEYISTYCKQADFALTFHLSLQTE